eukprot:6337071-Amphidinium_carterae.1
MQRERLAPLNIHLHPVSFAYLVVPTSVRQIQKVHLVKGIGDQGLESTWEDPSMQQLPNERRNKQSTLLVEPTSSVRMIQ